MTADSQLHELVFKRFPAEKQEQVRGLVSYATLMGLDGKDLVSIGNKLRRIDEANEKKSNYSKICDFECFAISENKRILNLDENFRLKTPHGSYKLVYFGGHTWHITNYKTRVNRIHRVKNENAKFAYRNSCFSWNRERRFQILLDIADGHLMLNF